MFIIRGKTLNLNIRTINLKILLQLGMMNLISDGSYSISGIQDYFECFVKNHEIIADNLPVEIYTNKIKNKIVFKIKPGYKLQLLSPRTMKLWGSTKKDGDQDKDGEDLSKLESLEVF